MKNTIIQCFFKGLCLTFISLMTLTTLHAQQYDDLSKTEKESKSLELINEAEYLIEGKPISGECFYGPDGKTIYTDVSIEVTHWYKGKGKKNIHLIMKGGIIKELNGGDLIINNQTSNHHSGGPFMIIDSPYFMVLKQSAMRGYEFIDQYSASSYGRYSNYPDNDFYIKTFYDLKFESMDDFETFVSKVKGVRLSRKKRGNFLKFFRNSSN